MTDEILLPPLDNETLAELWRDVSIRLRAVEERVITVEKRLYQMERRG